MSQSLYRKWRPQTFEALKGQDVIRDTIFYALTHDHMSQAYLFCGPRGTGKTTTARLIAKLINCLNEGDNRPCNTCAACTTITEGSNLDVLEVDAASNRGIDEIRQLRDSVRFSPTQAKYKVFIIDEVHMLTREAFNALLKTLEEPPAYAIFILATTEAHKIPPTIASRCQRYDFRLATLEVLADHLAQVAHEEGMTLKPEAARFIARLGEGSFRDALSLLEQVRTVQAKEYDLKVIEGLFGYVPREQMEKCLTAILQGNYSDAHRIIDDALARGSDLKAFTDQLLSLSQECLEALGSGDTGLLGSNLVAICHSIGLGQLVHWIELLLEAVSQVKQCPIPRLPLDVAIAKFGGKQTHLPPVKPVMRAIEPQSISAPAPEIKVVVSEPEKKEASAPVQVQETVSVPVAVTVPEAVSPEDWQNILQGLKVEAPSLITSLSHARVQAIESNVLKVAVRYKMHADKINQPKNQLKIEPVIHQVLQVPLRIEAEVVKDLVIDDEETVDVSQVFEFED